MQYAQHVAARDAASPAAGRIHQQGAALLENSISRSESAGALAATDAYGTNAIALTRPMAAQCPRRAARRIHQQGEFTSRSTVLQSWSHWPRNRPGLPAQRMLQLRMTSA